MNFGLLRIEDCLEDSPQTRALIGVYEKDAEQLLDYAQDINAACQRVSQAQNELAVATQALTQKLKDFQISSSGRVSENENFASTIQQLAASIDEVSSYNTVLYSELSENMEYQSQRFLDKELAEYLRLKSNFHTSDKVHEDACAKLARVSKKAKSEKAWQEATDQLYATRKSFHNTSMSYCCCLNDLQNKKKAVLLKPILSYLRSQIIFFRMGLDLGKPELEDVLLKISQDMTTVEKASEENRELLVERMDRLDVNSTRAYIPDPPASMDFPDLPVDPGKTQISGYLFYRSRSGLLTQWHRSYFFTQGGNLMQQNKREVAGQLFMDLDGCSASTFDIDDRRNVFQIISSNGKHICTLQGQSKQQCEEWICTIRNIACGLYLEDNPREAIDRARQASMSNATSGNPSPDQKIEKLNPLSNQGVQQVENPARSSSFDKKQESSKGSSMFARLRHAASSFIATEEKSEKDVVKEEPKEPPLESTTNQELQSLASKASGDNSLDAVLDTNDPILFDLPSPVSQKPTDLSKNEVSENQEGTDISKVNAVASYHMRHNPFSENKEIAENSLFKAMFVVRFLGCKRVSPESDLNVVIAETIWQVMTARALNKIFRMNELHLVVSDKTLRLVDPITQSNRESFAVSHILETKTHSENPRLLGFVMQRDDELMCYTFESNADGDDVCCAINTALVMQQSKMEHEENQKQKEMELDLEKQSRMITASNSPPGNEEPLVPSESLSDDQEQEIAKEVQP